LVDTRQTATLAPNSVLEVPVAGRAGVPVSASGAVLNVTAVNGHDAGYLTVYPCGSPPPVASNVNYSAGQTVPNLAMVGLGANGSVCIYSLAGADVIVDVTGYFGAGGSAFAGVTPTRLLDTRQTTALGAGETRALPVAGTAGVPAGATGVVVNVTATDPQSSGYITIFPCGTAPPTASNLNYQAGQTVPNLAATGLGGGALCLYSYATTHVIVDITGYYQ
jgi:hypothetical protein